MNIPIIKTTDTGIDAAMAEFEARRTAAQGLSFDAENEINSRVAEIIRGVSEGGDDALLEYTRRFDGACLSPDRIRVEEKEVRAAMGSLPEKLVDSLKISAERIRKFQQSILLSNPAPIDENGRMLALRYLPVDAAGICVPGASASLASSVLMNAIPAAEAGVKRIVMITPPEEDGGVSADRLAAAHIAGVDEIYRVFGAQAIAALAFGTESIKPVDFIAGPGNVFVSTAKKSVFGRVGIDMIAGPSEVVVLGDKKACPVRCAAELISQGEHTDGGAVLLTDSGSLAKETAKNIEKQSAGLENCESIRQNLKRYGCIIQCATLGECINICNRIAPEHLVLMCENPDAALDDIRHAGAVFVGPHTPVAAGDYIAGPSHTLPTGTTARFASGLTANHFLKSNSIIRYTREALQTDAEDISTMAKSEGLPAHAQSVKVRGDLRGGISAS